MTLLDQYDGVAAEGAPADQVAARQAGLVREWLRTSPEPFFAELRGRRPVLLSPGLVLVARYADAVEILTRADCFGVPFYDAKMRRLVGPFVLGMEDSAVREREVAVLRLALPRSDAAELAIGTARAAQRLLPPGGPDVEVVAGYFRPLITSVFCEYLGLDGAPPIELAEWCRSMFFDLFLNVENDPEAARRAGEAARVLRNFVEECVVSRPANPDSPTADVLGRLLRLSREVKEFTPDRIAANLIGLLVGALDTTLSAAVLVLDHLLGAPELLRTAVEAASAADPSLLAGYCREALRFRPQSLGLLRVCTQPFTLSSGAGRIEAGSPVFVGTASAMKDPARFGNPEEFRTDRPEGDYLYFGTGLHSCAGRYLAPVVITEALRSLLKKAPARVDGLDNLLGFDATGSFPISLRLQYGM